MTRYVYLCRLIAVTMLLFFFNCLSAQKTDNQNIKNYKNVVGVEMLGHGFGYTISYERLLLQNDFFRTTAQIGFAYYGTKSDATPLWIPITINQLKPLGEGQFLELGVGKMIHSQMPIFTDLSGKGGLRMEEWIMRLGFRYQHPDRRMLFKMAYTPFLRSGGITHWGGMGFGLQF